MKLPFAVALIALLTVQTARAGADMKVAVGHVESHSTKSCPEGFTLNGKSCELIELLEPNFVCPSGTLQTDGRCLTFAPVKNECPRGFTLTGEECRAVETEPADYMCEEGELIGSSCKVVVEQPPVCPKGFVPNAEYSDAGACVTYRPRVPQCPVGFVQSGESCLKTVQYQGKPVCPKDMQLSDKGQVCTRLDEQRPFCPSGYQADSFNECTKPVSKVPVACPDGYTVTGNICQRVEAHPVALVCPESMELDSKRRVCSVDVPVASRCPADFKPIGEGQCQRIISAKPVCPNGTRMVGSECLRDVPVEKLIKCPPGHALIGGKCKRVEKFPVQLVCLEGTRQRDQCVWTETFPPMLQCPAGFELSKGTGGAAVCSRQIEKDCSKTVMRRQCEMPEILGELEAVSEGITTHNIGGSKGKRLLKEPPTAVKLRPVSKSPVCRQVPVTVPKVCIATETVPASYACPDEAVLVGKMCQVKRMTELTPTCANGDMDAAGRCLKISVTHPTFFCPPGTRDNGDVCLQPESEPIQFVCPDGTKDLGQTGKAIPKCAEIRPELTFAPRKDVVPAKPICASGTLQGDKCVEVFSEPRLFECPSGSTEIRGLCQTTVPMVQPPPVEAVQAPRYVCPDGRPANNKICLEQEEVNVDKVCPKGTEELGRKCGITAELVPVPPVVKRTPALPVCTEEGFELVSSSSLCKRVLIQPVLKLCPNGFELSSHRQDDKCERELELKAVCPPGTVKDADGQCLKKKQVAPTVTLVKTCTKGQPGCN